MRSNLVIVGEMMLDNVDVIRVIKRRFGLRIGLIMVVFYCL